jgi:NADH dehydrogenase
MRVLVVGGTGFIGEVLCAELDERGHEVTALSRTPESGDLPADVERVAGDVTDYDAIEAAFENKDAAVNLVALSPLFRPAGDDEAHFTVHRDGTENVVRAAEAHGVGRLLQMSALGADPDGDTAYIRSKGLAEAVVRKSDLEWTIFRPSVVFGDGGEFIPYTKRLAPPYLTPLPGGGTTRFQPVWVGDLVPMLADAVAGVAPDDGPEPQLDDDLTPAVRPADDDTPHAGATYEVGGPEVLTLAEVARLAHGADGKPVDVVSVPMPLARVGLSSLDAVPVGVLDALPGVPRMGSDQYRSLQLDNTTADNDVDVFGVAPAELRMVADYLEVDPETVGS